MDLLFPYPKMGNSWLEILHDPLTRKLLGFDAVHAEKGPFLAGVSSRLKFLLSDTSKHLSFLKIGYTALEAFLQANCTGPPLPFDPEESIFPEAYRGDDVPNIRQEMLKNLAVDGNAVYHLTPHVELFWLAKLIMSNPTLAEPGFNGRRARFRVNHWHQKLLGEKSEWLKDHIYADAEVLESQLYSRLNFGGAAAEEHFVEFLIERAQVRILYGDDARAREDLARAAQTRNFQFALTGALGKRTKFQRNDLSQLVVLAKSRDHEPESYASRKSSRADPSTSRRSSKVDVARSPPASPSVPPDPATMALRPLPPTSAPTSPVHEHKVSPLAAAPVQPENILLNDDTLLEQIKFKEQSNVKPEMTQVSEESKLPTRLAELDPSSQPMLFPMDSIILLATASSISNTSPDDGLTREETLPYATRVLEGGSSNWQVYTQALLVRSRIEGYKSRTVERGLLQLQALVDQVIAETTQVKDKPSAEANTDSSAPATFLPKARDSESASVAERLMYIHQLSSPLRWELEAELAQRWTSMGGLKSALEIYERLQMQAEVALCLAATDREKEAEDLIRGLVFAEPSAPAGEEKILRTSPTDTPRLLCILGDITSNPLYYQTAWTHSRNTYARAQRSLGKHYMRARDYSAAANAYSLALTRGKLDHSTWFSLGCAQIELLDFESAVNSFQRCVALDDRDAESWSNLAISLLRLPEPDQAEQDDSDPAATPRADSSSIPHPPPRDDDPESFAGPPNPHRNKQMALSALRKAATLKRDDARIWDNYLTVAASIPPSGGTPWAEIIQAMQRVIELRGKKEGEAAVDVKIFSVLVHNGGSTVAEELLPEEASSNNNAPAEEVGPPDSSQSTTPTPQTTTTAASLSFLPRALLTLSDVHISPLVTTSPKLYYLLATLALWRHRPSEALSLHEKAWRAVTSRPDAYTSEAGFGRVVTATEVLVAAYEDLGGRESERLGGGAGEGRKVEEKWRFKARTAVRGVLGKGREVGEGTEAYERLKQLGESEKLKG
ncbi:TPR repeat-containing protein C19B12.01 [Cyphellophora attinorum]|uniref:TPR repeat-containing protein C19B12.01 n=1 Tax=Cyphellophora attinorum TaxID=1664694 RepID=A0A0N1HA18_9EURO|nr:TPR repeat-containing protein C19B12.01 [Phialophora attinorum]KPI40692.1 TPR repeat-containing protein C19B12.01 [Phialophora attinorum]